MTDTELMTTAEAAEYLGLSEESLKVYRNRGTGPRYVEHGKGRIRPRIGYRRADLDAYRDDIDVATATFAHRSVALAVAVAEVADADLDALFWQIMRADAAVRDTKPAVADLYRALDDWLLAEYARRGRKPAYTKPARTPRAEGPTPYL